MTVYFFEWPHDLFVTEKSKDDSLLLYLLIQTSVWLIIMFIEEWIPF